MKLVKPTLKELFEAQYLEGTQGIMHSQYNEKFDTYSDLGTSVAYRYFKLGFFKGVELNEFYK